MARYSVVGGPSKWDLMLGLFDPKYHQRVTFEVIIVPEGGQTQPRTTQMMQVVVNSVMREDGSGESWLITGWQFGAGTGIEGYFRTDTRKGWLVTT